MRTAFISAVLLTLPSLSLSFVWKRPKDDPPPKKNDEPVPPPPPPFTCPVCPPTTPTNTIRLAYLVTVHDDRTLLAAESLLDHISHPNNIVLLHVDTKYKPEYWQFSTLNQVIEECACGTRLIASVAECEWGKWSMNEPVLWALDELSYNPDYKGHFDKFITLSGDTLPTLTANGVGELFSQVEVMKEKNFITSHWSESGLRPTKYNEFNKNWHKRKAYSFPAVLTYTDMFSSEVYEKKPIPIYFGSQWMTLNADVVEFLGKSMRDPQSLANQLKEWMMARRKVVTDETFFPTIIMSTDEFVDSIPARSEKLALGEGLDPAVPWLKSIRFERMDEHAPDCKGYLPDTQRMVAMEGVEPRVWGPYFLGIYDLKDVVESGALWIRKVSSVVEGNLYKVFPCESREEIESLPLISWDPNVDYVISERPVF